LSIGIHLTTEEKYFYNLLETVPEARHDALEAVNEHHIEMIIKDSEGFPRDHKYFPGSPATALQRGSHTSRAAI